MEETGCQENNKNKENFVGKGEWSLHRRVGSLAVDLQFPRVTVKTNADFALQTGVCTMASSCITVEFFLWSLGETKGPLVNCTTCALQLIGEKLLRLSKEGMAESGL